MLSKKRKISNDNILKCVIVGDGYVGKTCLLLTFVNGTFPSQSDYVPTVFENYSVSCNADGREYSFILFDTAGQEDYDRLRSLAYYNADVFVVCFSLDSNESLKNVSERWIKEIRQSVQYAPLLLVCTKSDLSENKSLALVPDHRATNLAKDIKAEKYIKCSALNKTGVTEVFDEAFRSARKWSISKKKGSVCCVL